ncbi:hypothetical protein VNO77_29513 [Canavalia gladiata]|uniref:Uncharacterized protein n=1 Tax=Canavalia gladiata TaxID=3824 RepID=A0AAN9KXW8_CANGL
MAQVYCGSWWPSVRAGGIQIQSESNWHSNDKFSWELESRRRRRRNISCEFQSVRSFSLRRACRNYSLALTTLFTATAVIASVATADATREPETLSNIPQTLSGDCTLPKDCKKGKIQKPKSKKAESCTIRCVTTCIRGGEGSPGEGPLNVTRPLVVFKQGFRTRQYCLVECSDICNLMSDAEVTKN